MEKGLVLYYTVYGNTEKAARAVCKGIEENGLNVECIDLRSIDPREVLSYDFIVIGSPTHMESIPEEVKRFMDALGKLSVKGRKSAAFDTRYEDAERGGLEVLEKYMKDSGMIIIREGLPVLLPAWAAEGPLKEGELSRCREFGRSVANSVLED